LQLTPETRQLLCRQEWPELEAIPTERFSREMLKGLSAKVPEQFFRSMVEYNLGRHWLPELFRMPEIPAGPLKYHPEGDLFAHSLEVLQRASTVTADPLTRFCAFFHDIGKLATDPALYPKHHGHDETGFRMAIDFCNRLCLPADYRKALAWVSRLHGKLNRWEELRDSTKIRMAEQSIKAGIQDILPIVSRADKAGNCSPEGWGQALKTAVMTVAELGIDQEKLEKLPTGKRADYILQKRLELMRSGMA
jgi:tRNA nucleotidyltransferase (CCA-adding enzyme)